MSNVVNEICEHPFWSFYILGCVCVLVLGLVELNKLEKENKDKEVKDDIEYGMMIPYVMLSWLSIIFRIIGYLKNK